MSGSEERGDWRVTGAFASALVLSLCNALFPLGEAVGAMESRSTALLEPARPYLTVLAFVLLGGGFWLRYKGRRSPVESAEGEPPRSFARLRRLSFWTTTLLVITLNAFPYVYPWAAQKIIRRHAPVRVARRDPNVRLVLRIEGMDCIMCAAGLQSNLRGLIGVHGAEVSFQDKQAVIDYDPGAASVADIKKAIAASGFKVATAVP